MAKRRKYTRRGSLFGSIRALDWTMNPETVREVVAVILLLLGIIVLLGMFNLAGSFGRAFIRASVSVWGVFGYIVPFIFIGYGVVMLFPNRFKPKPMSVIGTILCLIFLPALFNTGAIGVGVRHLFESFLGVYAGLIIIFALSIVSLMITFNTSIRALWQRLGKEANDLVHVNDAKASVFTTLNRRQAPSQQPLMAQRTADQTWEFPSIDIFEDNNTKATSGNIAKNVEIIQKTLKDFNIDVSMGEVNIGPTVTQYSFKPAEGVKLTQITARQNDLALALAAHPIRVEAPIPGKAAVGIEIPNKVRAIVSLKEVLQAPEYKDSKSNLSIALGRDVAGMPIIADIKKMPHALIAGATGSGKSVCINAIIMSLLYQNSPQDLRLILVDPKRVEFTQYNGIPHLLTPVVHDVDKTISALKWTVAEMDRRFRLFQETNRRNIEAYNADPPNGHLPYIVVIIDELADLMAQAANEVESAIVRLAQMARAVGIHLIVATQRPSVDVITGLIKANITNRIAFAVASQIDSRTILDLAGAERLLGNGDMLYIGNELGKPKRIQGVMVNDKEIGRMTDFLRTKGQAVYDESILNYHAATGGASGSGELVGEDELYNDAKETVVMAGKASASLLQRRLRVGYARAARLLDILEQNGVIGPADGAKPRDVLIDPIELEHERQQVTTPMNQNFQSAPQSQPNYGTGFNQGFAAPANNQEIRQNEPAPSSYEPKPPVYGNDQFTYEPGNGNSAPDQNKNPEEYLDH